MGITTPKPPLNEHKPLNHPKKPDLEERKKTTTTIITFGGSFIFFSHLMVPLSHWVLLTSYFTVFFSYSVVL